MVGRQGLLGGPPVHWSSPASYLPHLPVSASRADMWAVNYLPNPC